MPSEELTAVRVDRYLTAVRIFKSRTAAQDACSASHVKVNGKSVRPSAPLRIGDKVEARAPRGQTILIVTGLAEKRLGAAAARELYEDRSPPPEEKPKEQQVAIRQKGQGRPTKADRRKIERFRGGFD